MSPPEHFTFGVPLIARAPAGSWRVVETLLDLTLASVRAQTDRDFRVVVAGHDRPDVALGDAVFLEADWPAEAVRADNLDSGQKKHAIQDHVLASGGGLLIFLDADDWVDTHLVAMARAGIRPGDVGGFIAKGFATDLRRLRTAPLPHPRIFAGGFHQVCGSSTVARLQPDHPDPLRRDPFRVLHEHYRWVEVAREHGATLATLPVSGCYVINTAANHSELHGPHTDWRRGFTEAVAREGRDIDDAFTSRFGLRLDQVRAASERIGSGEARPRLERTGNGERESAQPS